MLGIILERHESVPRIELASRIINGVHLDGPDADVLRKMLRAAHSVNQQKAAQALALLGSVNREPAQEHDRHIRVRQTLGLLVGQGLITDGVT